MKILALIHGKDHQLNDSLVSQGSDLTVYLSDKKDLELFSFAKKAQRYTTIKSLTGFGDWFFFTLFAPILWLISISRALIWKAKGYNVVIMTNLSDKLLYTLWLRLFRVRVIWVESHYYPESFTSNIYVLLFGLLSKFVTLATLSLAIQKQLVQSCYVKEKLCAYVGTSIDLESTKSQSDIYDTMVSAQHQVHNANLFVIGFMGDVGLDSGLETLVKAVESIKEFIVDMQLIVVGDGDQKKNVAWLTKMLGLDDRIRFVGKQQNWMRWYNYFDIFVCPRQSKTEFSFETAYALAHGIPTIVSSLDGMEEICAYQSGYIIKPGASHDLGQAILDLYNNKKQREIFGQQGKKRAIDEYSKDAVSKRWNKLLVTNS